MKVHDKLYCFNSIEVDNIITVGKLYCVVGEYDDYYEILDDNNRIHYFSFEKYEDFFITIKELRKQKLEKIKNVL